MSDINSARWWKFLVKERALLVLISSCIVILLLHNLLLSHPYQPLCLLGLFVWLLGVILYGEFAIVRHGMAIAILLREPVGTLVLTLSIVAIEVTMIGSVMLTGASNPTLARDTIYAIIMIMLNGLLGVTLLLGGWRYREQQINLQGAKSYLSVILLIAVFGLIVPGYTNGLSGFELSPFLTIFLIIISLGIYIIFLGIQTVRHRKYFLEVHRVHRLHSHHHDTLYASGKHLLLLLLYLAVVMVLIKIIAVPIDYGMANLAAPRILGGVFIGLLILAPEAVMAIRDALCNQLQHAVNVLLGSVLAAIGLIIPAVLVLALLTGQTLILGLNDIDAVILALSLIMSILTIGSGRTNVLQGAIHLLIFFSYLALLFD